MLGAENIVKNGICRCQICQDKARMAEKIIAVSVILCEDYRKKHGEYLYAGDWFEILLTATLKAKDVVYPDL